MDRIDTLTTALETAKKDEAEAKAVGFVMAESGPIFYVEAWAIRVAIEKVLDEALMECLFGESEVTEIALGEFVPLSGLIDFEDRF